MNYVSVGRTNYFAVKDETAFLAWVASRDNIEAVKSNEKNNAVYCLIAKDGFSDFQYSDVTDEEINVCIPLELSAHLVQGAIVVFIGTGGEGIRALDGWALAINDKGEMVEVSTEDIYQKAAQKFNVHVSIISRAEY